MNPAPVRKQVLEQLADAIVAVEKDHPVRVGIDGITAAGKTVLADELAAGLRQRGRPVIRASSDGFHQPAAHRYRRGRDCPVGYAEDSFDDGAIVRCVLAPLGPGGNGRYRPVAFNHHTDQPVPAEAQSAPAHALLLFEGVMLFRPGLDEYWDYRIYVHVDFATGLSRAEVRDLESMGSIETIHHKHATRFRPGQQAYLDTHRPRECAHAVIDNHDPTRPVLTFSQWTAGT